MEKTRRFYVYSFRRYSVMKRRSMDQPDAALPRRRPEQEWSRFFATHNFHAERQPACPRRGDSEGHSRVLLAWCRAMLDLWMVRKNKLFLLDNKMQQWSIIHESLCKSVLFNVDFESGRYSSIWARYERLYKQKPFWRCSWKRFKPLFLPNNQF